MPARFKEKFIISVNHLKKVMHIKAKRGEIHLRSQVKTQKGAQKRKVINWVVKLLIFAAILLICLFIGANISNLAAHIITSAQKHFKHFKHLKTTQTSKNSRKEATP